MPSWDKESSVLLESGERWEDSHSGFGRGQESPWAVGRASHPSPPPPREVLLAFGWHGWAPSPKIGRAHAEAGSLLGICV